MYFLVHFCIKVLINPKKILIIVQRSNGDVFLSLNLITELYNYYNHPQIDILINDDTLSLAKLLPYVASIHTFSYAKKRDSRLTQEAKLVKSIFRNYDLSVNLTASDRSVVYSVLASKKSISAIEKKNNKSWWKKIFLYKYYYFDKEKHIFLNNLEPLNLLNISYDINLQTINVSKKIIEKVKKKIHKIGIKEFFIFHPSAQYSYKIYPQHLRDELLNYLSNIGVPIIVTGTNNKIDFDIKLNLPSLPNIIDFVGETSLEEYFALSSLAKAYIGMDTLNMHIASSQNKRIFAIFGPTKLNIWSPWSNQLKVAATKNQSIQEYGNITIFQADMSCVACGNAGCDDSHGKSECLDNISPKLVFHEVESWYQKNIS